MFKLVVLSVTLALAAASPSGLLGLGLGWGGHWGGHWGAPLAAVAAPLAVGHGAYNYRGPLSLAPGQPANILAADGRPLDTLSVNLDRAAHYTARAVDGGLHVLKKRSVLAAPAVAWSHAAGIGWPGARLVAPAVAPVAVAAAAPLAVAPWGGHAAWGVGHGARWGHGW
ncbi:cuticle protein 63-like [Zerene cesonia]|uniref:cuticle protein 63-like n=1 Tax=Zerene cesonia TaxID=33412 RepID=UPI0018E51876|nr:cuticle protein 63-like [Zerene cesonia]